MVNNNNNIFNTNLSKENIDNILKSNLYDINTFNNLGLELTPQNININNITTNIGNLNINTSNSNELNDIPLNKLTLSKINPEINKIYIPLNSNLLTKNSGSPESRAQKNNSKIKNFDVNSPTYSNQNLGFVNVNNLNNINNQVNYNLGNNKNSTGNNNQNIHNNFISNPGNIIGTVQDKKNTPSTPVGKGLNIIPLKNFNSQNKILF